MRVLRHIAAWVLAAAVATGAAPLPPAWAEDGWQATLKLQLTDEKKCLLERFVSMRQAPVGQPDGIEGRVRCIDGREFDFSRQKAHQKFDIRLCQPAVC
jgi:hypothetical protein